MYAKIKEGKPVSFPYSQDDLRRENPNTSFPRKVSDSLFASYGVFPVKRSERPSHQPLTEKIESKIELVDGSWVQNWEVVRLPQKQAEDNIRGHRNSKLAKYDWMAYSDVVMPDHIKRYRQALRDVPSQDGFPYSVIWPTEGG